MGSIRHVFLTGAPSSGKSTLCRSVVADGLDAQWQGFFTGEVREQGERIGFDVITVGSGPALKGPLARVAREQASAAPRVGKYCVDVASFERLALPALRLDGGAPRLVLIDEVGKMELFSRAFFPAVRAVLDAPHTVVLGTIPTPRDGRVMREVAEICGRPDVEVLTVTRDNRNALVGQVAARLRCLLQAMPPPPLASSAASTAAQPQPASCAAGAAGPGGAAAVGGGSCMGAEGTGSNTTGPCGAAWAGQARAGSARGWSARMGAAPGGLSSPAGAAHGLGLPAARTGGWGQQLGAGAGSAVRFVGGSSGGAAAAARTGAGKAGDGAL
ncbi:hypothetical protein HYH02_001984 [Chlamydomonas schloesseri]|uniref:AAA+ ATPase domain-containing protein n=1 Tax=Chlamydomonas schloesseri TaxID=2026947 RepID=A0A836BCG7_9CHLO|nr:hypothetical protein HYH02_001984 [Chlamydomonas schloesseri]|eukprot:KAG2453774.1 hypothetical protein HYH02_001984 [Chlamydomonas schloesseri]